MREQVVTPRAARTKAAKAEQRPAARRHKPAAAKQGGSPLRAALPYLPLALKVALAVVAGVLVFAAYRSAASASFFAVKTVDVEGARRASREEIRGAVRQMARAGVWQADLDLIAAELRGMPWVRDVVVARVLPSGLRVRVAEREPRLIARTPAGRLVWVDDDGVVLGAAQPDGDDFFVRGVEEGRDEETLGGNRARVAAALELARGWEREGLKRRVSEVNLADPRDVRVQLAGADAHVEVRLGRDDLVKRFRQALDVLDAQRGTPRGPFVTYVDVSQGRRAVVGTGATAHALPDEGAEADAAGPAPAGAPAPGTAAGGAGPPAKPAPPARAAGPQGAGRASNREGKKEKKRPEAERQADVALRPRRVG